MQGGAGERRRMREGRTEGAEGGKSGGEGVGCTEGVRGVPIRWCGGGEARG